MPRNAPTLSTTPAFTSSAPWNGETDRTLVVACSDPRFREATEEFFQNHFGLNRYDSLFIPGGPICVLLTSSMFFVIRPLLRWLCQSHHLKKVISVSHFDCGYYKYRYPRLSEDERRNRQVVDLKQFGVDMNTLFPGVQVENYFAVPREGHIDFLAVT